MKNLIVYLVALFLISVPVKYAFALNVIIHNTTGYIVKYEAPNAGTGTIDASRSTKYFRAEAEGKLHV